MTSIAKVAKKNIEVHNATETRKLVIHFTLITLGLVATVAMTYIPSDLILHLIPLGVGVPAIIQEVLDRIIKGF